MNGKCPTWIKSLYNRSRSGNNHRAKTCVTSTHDVLSILGAGGHGQVIADAAQMSGRWSEVRLYDDNTSSTANTKSVWPVAGTTSDLLSMPPAPNHQAIVGIGDNVTRLTLHTRLCALGWSMATVVHPSAIISKHADVLAGTVVLAGAVINVGTLVDEACIINTRASIDHDCRLGPGVHISPGALLAGTVTIGSRAWIGMGSVVINNLHLGDDVILGAGATAISDIAAGSVAVGSPAQAIRTNRLKAPRLGITASESVLAHSRVEADI